MILLNLLAVVLLVALIFLGLGVFQQVQLLNQVFADTSINGWRGLIQADRQVLLLRSQIIAPPDTFDAKAFAQQRAVTGSRFDVLRSGQFQDAVTSDLLTQMPVL